MANRKIRNLVSIALVLAFACGLIAASAIAPAQIASATVPTPAAPGNGVSKVAINQWPLYFTNQRAITSNSTFGPVAVAQFGVMDVQYVVTQGPTTPNTITLQLQYSVDGNNWVTGPNLVVNSSVSGTDLAQFPVFGVWSQVNAIVSGTLPVTLTVVAVGK